MKAAQELFFCEFLITKRISKEQPTHVYFMKMLESRNTVVEKNLRTIRIHYQGQRTSVKIDCE